jgi:hypothetical protein
MLYEKIETYLETHEGMTKLLEEFKEAFERIEFVSDLFKEGNVNTHQLTDQIMKELGGWYSSLNVVVMLSETKKKNHEACYFNSVRNQMENVGKKKVIAAVIDREVSESASSIRRIRNIFQSYRDNCDRLMSVCQSSLKALEREKGMANLQ